MDIHNFILDRYFPTMDTITTFEHLKLIDEKSQMIKEIEDKFNGKEPKLNRKERRRQDKLNRPYRTNVMDLLIEHRKKNLS